MKAIPIHKTKTYQLKRKGQLYKEVKLYSGDILHIDERKTTLVIN